MPFPSRLSPPVTGPYPEPVTGIIDRVRSGHSTASPRCAGRGRVLIAGAGDYFPQWALSRWLAGQGLPSTVYAFPKVGVQPLRSAYRTLVDRLGVDALVLGGSPRVPRAFPH